MFAWNMDLYVFWRWAESYSIAAHTPIHYCCPMPYSLRYPVMIAFLLLSPSGQGNGVERHTQERQLKEIRGRIAAVTSKINAAQERRSGAQKTLREVERRLGREQKGIRTLDIRIAENARHLTALKSELSDLHQRLTHQKKRLAQQIRAAYVAGNQEKLKLLFNQESPEEFSRMVTYYDYLNRARSRQIEDTQHTLARIAQVQAGIKQNNITLVALKEKHEQRQAILAAQRGERQKILDTILGELQRDGQALNTLKRSAEEIEQLLMSLGEIFADIPEASDIKVPFARLKGRLPWPTRGVPMNTFGGTRKQGGVTWGGLLLNAPAGRNVSSVSSGRIAFADWLRGLGLLIIIDHGDGYLSLYGHNQVLLKEVGDWVNANEVIAQVGDSGGLEQAALYFELRHQGKPINPLEWCKRLLKG